MRKTLVIIIIILSAVFIAVYAALVIIRATYPYPLWVLEDEVFIHALRLSRGMPVYQDWDSTFVPLIYPPFYYFAGAICIKVFPFLPALRIISATAILGTFAIVMIMLARARVSRLFLVATAGFLCAVSPMLGGNWEQVKVDGLMLLSVLWAGEILTREKLPGRNVIVAAVLFGIAFFTKQTAAPFIIAGALFVFWREKRQLFLFLASLAVALVGLSLLIYVFAGKEFAFYIFNVPLHQPLDPRSFFEDLLPLWLRRFPVILLLSAISVPLLIKHGGGYVPRLLIYYLPASLLAYILPRCKFAGYSFNMLPFVIIRSVLAGWGFHVLKTRNSGNIRALRLLLVLVLLQFALLTYNPFEFVPNADNYRINEAAVNEISRLEGQVYLPVRCYVAYLAGKDEYASFVAIQDVISSGLKAEYPAGLFGMLAGGGGRDQVHNRT